MPLRNYVVSFLFRRSQESIGTLRVVYWNIMNHQFPAGIFDVDSTSKFQPTSKIVRWVFIEELLKLNHNANFITVSLTIIVWCVSPLNPVLAHFSSENIHVHRVCSTLLENTNVYRHKLVRFFYNKVNLSIYLSI